MRGSCGGERLRRGARARCGRCAMRVRGASLVAVDARARGAWVACDEKKISACVCARGRAGARARGRRGGARGGGWCTRSIADLYRVRLRVGVWAGAGRRVATRATRRRARLTRAILRAMYDRVLRLPRRSATSATRAPPRLVRRRRRTCVRREAYLDLGLRSRVCVVWVNIMG